MYIRHVNFDKGYRHCQQGIPQGDAGMCERGRVEDHEADTFLLCGMNPVDNFRFRVALQKLNLVAGSLALLRQPCVDIF